jgi:peptide/nickel transport system substrate-binding protein
MRRIFLLSIAAASVLLPLLSPLGGERRPRYGGTLRMEMRAVAESADAGDWPVSETLVRYDEKGNVQPLLATSWAHDTANKRWVFATRANVMLHDGTPWQPGALAVPDDQPIEEILRGLAHANAVKTGPFKVTRWETGKSATLAAHDAYWGGRPFLDTVEIRMGRPWRDQALDFELGNADVIEVSPADVRRLRQRGANVTVTPARATLALVCDQPQEALALAIDRTAIHDVILQRQGEITGALVPPWLSGYAFLFAPTRDVARARQLAPRSELRFRYDRDDPLIRAIAERIVVNAAEAGITMRAAEPAQIRLMRLRISSSDLQTALADLAASLNAKTAGAGSYEIERSLLGGHRVIPLFHLPTAYQVAPRVHGWPRLEESWVSP